MTIWNRETTHLTLSQLLKSRLTLYKSFFLFAPCPHPKSHVSLVLYPQLQSILNLENHAESSNIYITQNVYYEKYTRISKVWHQNKHPSISHSHELFWSTLVILEPCSYFNVYAYISSPVCSPRPLPFGSFSNHLMLEVFSDPSISFSFTLIIPYTDLCS